MSRIDTLKLNADLLAMHDQPMRPDAADLNTLRDAMTVVSSYMGAMESIRQISMRANSPDACKSSMERMLDEIAEIASKELGAK